MDTRSGSAGDGAQDRRCSGKARLTGQLPSGLVVDVTTWGNTHGYEQRVRVEGTTTFDRFSVNDVDSRRCSDLFRRIDDLAEMF
jgi:hypothetical protein